MQVHHVANVPSFLAGVDKFAGEFDTELDVVGAAAPFPVGSRRAALAVVARARLDGSFRTGSRYRMRHGGRHQSVDESSFTASCLGWKRIQLNQIAQLSILCKFYFYY